MARRYISKLNEIIIGKIKQKHKDFPLMSIRELAAHFGFGKTSICRALAHRHSELRARRGRRGPTPQMKVRRRKLIALVEKTETVDGVVYPMYGSAPELADQMQVRYQIAMSPSSVLRDLKGSNYVSRVRIVVPTRDPGVIKTRLVFLRQMRALGKAACKMIIFSDEHVQPLNDFSYRRQFVKQGKNPFPRSRKRHNNVPCFQIWGAIGYNYKSPLIFFPKDATPSDNDNSNGQKKAWRLNGQRYKMKCLVPFIKSLRDRKVLDDYYFMHDGATCHHCSNVQNYLNSQHMDQIHGWPPYSPDLNPIENLWADMKRRVSKMRPTTSDELKACIQQYWDELTYGEINKYIDGFWNKVQGGIANGGAPLGGRRAV